MGGSSGEAGRGEPSGTLREAAQRLIERHIPEPGPAEYVEGLRRGLDLANRAGITSIIEANASDEILEAYRSLDRAGQLTVRVLTSIQVDPKKGPDQVPGLISRRETFVGQHLKSTTVKIFVDGVIESHTAALLEPYLDRQGDRGRPLLEQADFNRLAVALEQAGFQIHVHAIGDRAVRVALDAFEAARRANGPRDLRHHIAHLELFDPADVPRFNALGVAANFQPLWAYADLYITQLTEPMLGPERSSRLYPIGSVFRTGALIVGGSDWPVSSLNPLEAIQVAVTRRAPEDKAGPPWLPDQCIDLKTALAAYTTNGAFLAHRESEAGSLEPGRVADLIVLDRNLLRISPFEIHEARVLLTLLEGQVVYRDPALAAH